MRSYVIETGNHHPGDRLWVGKGLLGLTSFRDLAEVYPSKKEAEAVIGKFSEKYGLTVVPAHPSRKQ